MAILSGSVEKKFFCKHLSGGNRYIYWTDNNNQLLRREVNGTVKQNVETVANQFNIRTFTTNDDIIVWVDNNQQLIVGSIENGTLSSDIDVLETQFNGDNLVIDGSYLYWRDRGLMLRRPLTTQGFSNIAQTMAGYWEYTPFTISNDDILFVERNNYLYHIRKLSENIEDGVVELLSDTWNSVQFTAVGDTMFWLDPEGHLRRAKRKEESGNYIHFADNTIDWQWNWENGIVVDVDVSTTDHIRRYSTGISYHRPTGVPYQPKYQDWEYLVWWNWYYIHDYRVKGVYAVSEPLSVEECSKRTLMVVEGGKRVIKISDW